MSDNSQYPTEHTFERIQFQKVAANKGRYRAKQQLYNLVVDLYAKVSGPRGVDDYQWAKIARRVSVPLVVRGR
ncbi:hypothetical protein PHISCL_09273 [Aspergillus sclerotialis]|uniref:NDT80 domain-containing protein n=1 Tax=Aspergillus sclerotialis TaxID=2070753 RepID=A0A3A2ZGE9_9EURO|nr:hypothetical protein PHISCL_09273 [Aspergillus sclerotialis]